MRLFGHELQGFVKISGATLKVCIAGSFERSLIVAILEYVKNRFNATEPEDSSSNTQRSKLQRVRREDFDRIVDYFERYVSERDTFLENFKNWEIHRINTIGILTELASNLHHEKSVSNKVNIVADGAGVIGGVIKICDTIGNTPILPSWTRIVAKNASKFSSILRLGTTCIDYIYVEHNMKKARETINDDKKQFESMGIWFEYENDLFNSIKAAIGSDATKELFEVFQTCYAKIEEFKSNNVKASVIAPLVVDAFMEPLMRRNLATFSCLTVGMAVFQFMFVYYGHRKWQDVARVLEGVKTLSLDAMCLTSICLNAQDFSCASTYAKAASGVADLIPAIERAYRLFSNKDGSSSDQGRHLEEVADKLIHELDYFQELYTQVRASLRQDVVHFDDD